MKTITVGKNDAGQRLDRFLRKTFPSLPLSLIQKLIRTKRIKVNQMRAKHDDRLSEGDLVSLFIDDGLLEPPSEDEAFTKIARPELNIVYEDENILLLDKPPGLLCHSDDRETINTLISHVRAYLYLKGEYRPEDENAFAPALCNRIDRNTGGIVIAAKNSEALRIMNEKIRDREVEKHYLCLIHGTLQPPAGVLEGFILRDENNRQVKVFNEPRPVAKTARTVYTTIASKDGLSLVECRLITGRTHQIRAQMHHAGHPIAGDAKYANPSKPDLGLNHQALYSYKIRFNFKSDAGILNYLNQRAFEVDVPFTLPGWRKH